jgi:hypothetical protein
LVAVLRRHGSQVVMLEGLEVEVDVHLGVAQGGEDLAEAECLREAFLQPTVRQDLQRHRVLPASVDQR